MAPFGRRCPQLRTPTNSPRIKKVVIPIGKSKIKDVFVLYKKGSLLSKKYLKSIQSNRARICLYLTKIRIYCKV